MSRRHTGNGERHRSGVIRPHERETDNVTPTVNGAGLRPEYEAAIFNTEDKSMASIGRRDNRNRIRRMIMWIQENYPDIADRSVQTVLLEEKDMPHRYYWPDDDYDFVYAGLDPQYIKAFLAALGRSKPNGKMYGHYHICKFYDAIKWGSKVSNSLLSTDFFAQMDKFMVAYKKDYTAEKKKGNVDEYEADAITSTLFDLLMRWAVAEGNVFVWCFALLMWNSI
jgi:hypothetical protein